MIFLSGGATADADEGMPASIEISTVNISRYLPGIEDIAAVPELAAFKALS